MPEENKTAETTVDTEVDSHADVNQNEDDSVNDASFADAAQNDGDAGAGAQQSKEQNSQNARRRREAERKAELKRVEEETREKAIIEALNGINPYTNDEMKDGADVREFLAMREIEKNGGDPLADFSKFQKQRERKAAEETEKQKEKDEWFAKDREDFVAKYPEVNIEALIHDEDFQNYAAGKTGSVPLATIYEGFSRLTAKYEKKAKQIATQRVANKNASPGALASANPSDDGYYTEEQVRKMSTEEIKRDYEKVRASMTRWKK